VNLREILKAMFDVQRSGCQWEMLAHDLPPHGTGYKYFQKWERQGIWQQRNDQLRHRLRTQMGRREGKYPVAIADSQSVKTTENRGISIGSTAANSSRVANATW